MSSYVQPAVSNNIGLGINVFKTNNVTGILNVGVGGNILIKNTVGLYNTAIGANVFTASISGNNNCAIGSNSGNSIIGSNNTMLGANTGQVPGDTNTYNNSCAIGYGATVNASGQIVVGTASETVKIPSTVASTGPTVGALVVAGGINITGNLNVTGGSSIYMNGFPVGTSTNGTVITNFGTNSLTAGDIVVNNLNLSTNSITSGSLAVGSMISGNINLGANLLTAGNLFVGNIVSGTTSVASISVGTITTGTMFMGTLTLGNLYASSNITVGTLNLSALTAGNLSVGTLVGGATSIATLSGGVVTAGNISTGTVSATNMNSSAISAGSVNAGANPLIVGNMSVGNITSGGIVPTTVSGGTITVGSLSFVSLVSGNLSVGTIVSGTHNMSTNSLTSGNMYVGNFVASSLSTAVLSSGTITAGSSSAYAITTNTVSATGIAWTSLNMISNPLTAGNITVGTIVASTTNTGGNSLTAGNVSGGTIYGTSLNASNNPITAGGISFSSSVSSTMNMVTNSLACGNMSVGAIVTSGVGLSNPNPQYTLDVIGTVNAINYNNFPLTFNYNGGTSASAAPSAKYIQQNFGQFNDGVYWINLPTAGATQIYCIMNPAYAGGGWMMAMKGTRGTTFQYTTSYWYSVNTLNVSDTTRNDGDAKFQTFNYYPATDWMAIFPDTGINGGDLPASLNTGWTWVELNAVGVTIPPVQWYAMDTPNYCKSSNGTAGFNPTNPTPVNLSKFANTGTSNVWSAQGGFQWYGMNYVGFTLGYLTTTGISTVTTGTANANAIRWGFGWNNETDMQSNDIRGGIGLNYPSYLYSAGEFNYCCGTVAGLNRSMRFEWYVR
jgi:hypothetical protein